MHILFVAGWWPTQEIPTNGIFIKEHAAAISKFAKVTVVYLQTIEKSQSWFDFPSSNKKQITKVNENLTIIIIDLRLRVRRFGILEMQLNRLLKNIINGCKHSDPIDIIHLNVLHAYWPEHILRNCGKIKKPLVLSEHSSYYHTGIYQLPESQIDKRKKEITLLFNEPKLKYILPVSSQLAHLICADFTVPFDKMVPIPNVANEVFISFPIEKKQNAERIEIFAAAMWKPPKNPLLFFELLKLLKVRENTTYSRLKINWAGSGSQLEEIIDLVKKDLPDLKIDFLGMLTKDAICKQMRSADFLIHPTDAENLPCIIIESLCVGLPVLSANVNGITELIDASNGKMYCAKNLEHFYSCFLEMINDVQHFNNEQIASEARNKFSASAIGQQIMDVYKKVFAK